MPALLLHILSTKIHMHTALYIAYAFVVFCTVVPACA